MKKVLAIIIIAAVIAGCNLTQKNSRIDLEIHLQQGNLQQAIRLATHKAGLMAEQHVLRDQLWGMQSASLYRMIQNYDQSNAYFDRVESVMYQEDTEGLLESSGETIGALLTNDSYLDYEQAIYDSVMVNTYKALNFTAQGDLVNARVEWNRADDRQRRAAEHFAEKINKKKAAVLKDSAKNLTESLHKSDEVLASNGINMSNWQAYEGYINPFSTFMHGLFFMLAANDIADLHKAVDSFKRVKEMTNSSVASQSLDLAHQLLRGDSSHEKLRKVWVIFENARAAQKVETRLNFPLFLVSNNVTYTSVALPKLIALSDHFECLDIGGIKTEVIADMDKIIGAEFKEEFAVILSKEITRAIAKTAIQKQFHDQNPLLGLGASLIQAASTGADLRSWTMLPKNFQAAVVDIPDDNQLIIQSPGFVQPITVDVDENANSIIYIKAINTMLPPSIEVITL